MMATVPTATAHAAPTANAATRPRTRNMGQPFGKGQAGSTGMVIDTVTESPVVQVPGIVPDVATVVG